MLSYENPVLLYCISSLLFVIFFNIQGDRKIVFVSNYNAASFALIYLLEKYMKPEQISSQTARQIAIHAQLLNKNAEIPNIKKNIADLIERLGYIQIDTLSVIKRSHHHTIWTRSKNYRESTLHDLQTKERKIYEYWAHAMAYLPMSDFRYSLPRMKHFENPRSPWAKYQLGKCKPMLPVILERIRQEGPLGSKDFSREPGIKGGSWWDWKPAKVALEMLFWQGKLMITERRNFQKVYDLTERVLPSDINLTMPDSSEIGHFLVRRALTALGIASKKDIQNFMQPGTRRDADMQLADRTTISRAICNLTESGDILSVRIEDDKTPHYAASDIIQNTRPLKKAEHCIFLLSPFDNLIIQRKRTERLFGFDYALECYVPESKRKYGYFVLPVLWGNRFVARIDVKADRKNKILIIRSIIFEKEFKNIDALLPLLADKLALFVRFNDCESIQMEKCSPKKAGSALMRIIKQII